MDDINTELLITLVEERPAIWDKSLDDYKDKLLKDAAWREISSILNENFTELEQEEKQKFCKLVVKKWTQTRDSWMKSYKKQRDEKRSGSAKPRFYIYHRQMSFLKKIVDSMTDESNDNNTNITNEENGVPQIYDSQKNHILFKAPSQSGTHKRPKLEMTHELGAKMLKLIDQQIHSPNNEDDRHLSFFKGLLPSMSSLNEDQTLEFQAGVIALLQKIRKSGQLTHTGCYLQQSFNTTSIYQRPQQITSPGFESMASPSESIMSTTSQDSEEFGIKTEPNGHV